MLHDVAMRLVLRRVLHLPGASARARGVEGGRGGITSSGGRVVVWRMCISMCMTCATPPQVLHEVMMNENLVFECAGLTKGVGAPEKETELETA